MGLIHNIPKYFAKCLLDFKCMCYIEIEITCIFLFLLLIFIIIISLLSLRTHQLKFIPKNTYIHIIVLIPVSFAECVYFVNLSQIVTVSVVWIVPLYYLYSSKSVWTAIFPLNNKIDFTGTKLHLIRNNDIALALFPVWCVILACGESLLLARVYSQACAGVVNY